MGNPIQKLTENVSLIASEETWIEGLAIQQLEKTAELAGMHRVAGMPDLHPGKGYPIGAAFFSQKLLYPALVGNDIGCGMALWQTNVRTGKVNVDKLMKKLNDVESPLDDSWRDFVQERKQQKDISQDLFDSSLGTIGGGNHFAEFQQVTDIYEQTRFDSLGLDARQIQLLIHSGSRGLGQSILTSHVQQFNHNGLCDDSLSQQDYLHAHNDDMLKTSFGSRVICGDKELLYDEAPQANKDSTSIIEALTDAGLLTVIARLKPVLTFKTTGDCRS